MRFSTTLAGGLVFAGAALADHIVARHKFQRMKALDDNTFSKRNQFTYYETGTGACGGYNSGNEFVVAMSAQDWDGGAHCGKQITININGKSTQATIVDECMGCPSGDLDFSEGLFTFFSPTDAGVVHGDWSYGNGAPATTSSVYTPPPETTTSTSTYQAPTSTSSTWSSSWSEPTSSWVAPSSSSAAPSSSAAQAFAPSSSSASSSAAPVQTYGSDEVLGSVMQAAIGLGNIAVIGHGLAQA